MKKVLITLIAFTLFLGSSLHAEEKISASDSSNKVSAKEEVVTQPKSKPEKATKIIPSEEPKEEKGMHQIIKEKIVEGGTGFMSIVLICLILGLAIAIERVITLNLTGTNTKLLLENVKNTIKTNGVDAAREVCARTKGPIASIFAQGLLRMDESIDNVERSIESHGSAQVNKLEKGMSWISLFISLAPMFGFMGTVIGMIDAFESIESSDGIKISEVASGIKVALLTTVAGLIVAVILQVFYNYLSSKIDSIANQMEDASNDFIDMLVVSKKLK